MLKFLMLSCNKATLLTEQKMAAGRLSFYLEWQLRLHLKMCEGCRRFARQSAAIEQAFLKQLEESGNSKGADELIHLDPDMKGRILDQLRKPKT